MRRIVRDYVREALGKAIPLLEQHMADHLALPAPFPFQITHQSVAIRETRGIQVTARFGGDFPPVDVTVQLAVLLSGWMRKRDVDRGMQMLAADVEISLLGTPNGSGYHLVAQCARLTAWWGERSRPGGDAGG